LSEIGIRSGILGIVGIIVVLIMFGALLPLVTQTIDQTEATGTVGLLLDNMPLFLVLGVVLAVIASALVYLKIRGE
jgi:hypothetical protein